MNEQMPPGTVENLGFLLKVRVIGEAYMSQSYNQLPIRLNILGLFSDEWIGLPFNFLNDMLCSRVCS